MCQHPDVLRVIGFDHLVLINAGPDVDGFFRHVADTLGPRLREEVAAT